MGAGATKQYQSDKTRHAAAVLEAVQNYEAAHPSKFNEDYFPQAFKKRVLLAAAEAKRAGKDVDASLAQLTDADIETLWKYVEEQRLQQLEENKQATEENAAMEVEEFVEDETLGGQENGNDNIDETTSVLSYGEGENENEEEENQHDFSDPEEEIESPRSLLLGPKGSSKSNKLANHEEILEDLEQTTDIPVLKRMDSNNAMRGSAVKIFPMESTTSTPRRRTVTHDESKSKEGSSLTLSEPSNNIADALAKFWEIDEIGSIASQLSLGLESPRTGGNSNSHPFSPNVNRSSGGGANILGDERLMGLQRQKVMSYTQNAQLEREVEALQRQLERMEALDSNSQVGIGSPGLHRSMQSSSSTVHSSSKQPSSAAAQAKHITHSYNHMPMKLSYIYPIDEEANDWSGRSPPLSGATAAGADSKDTQLAARQKAAYYSHSHSSHSGNGKVVNGNKDVKKLLSSSSSDDDLQQQAHGGGIIHHHIAHHHNRPAANNNSNNIKGKAVVTRIANNNKDDAKAVSSKNNDNSPLAASASNSRSAATGGDKAAGRYANNKNSNYNNNKYYQKNDSGLDSDDSASVTSTSKHISNRKAGGGGGGGGASDSDSQVMMPLSARRNHNHNGNNVVSKRTVVSNSFAKENSNRDMNNNKEKDNKAAADHNHHQPHHNHSSPPPAAATTATTTTAVSSNGQSPSNTNATTAINSNNMLASPKAKHSHMHHNNSNSEARRARNTIASDTDHKATSSSSSVSHNHHGSHHHVSQQLQHPVQHSNSNVATATISEDEQNAPNSHGKTNKNNALKRANKRRHSADGLLIISQLPDEAQLQLLMEKQISDLALMSPGGKNRIGSKLPQDHQQQLSQQASKVQAAGGAAARQPRQRLSNASNDSQQQQQQQSKERQSSGMLSDHDFDALFAADSSPNRFPTHASTFQQTATSHHNNHSYSLAGTDSSMEGGNQSSSSGIPPPMMTMEDASPSHAHHTAAQQSQQTQQQQQQAPQIQQPAAAPAAKRKVRVKSVAAGAGAASKAAASAAVAASAAGGQQGGGGSDETSVTVKDEAWTRDLDNLWGEVSLLLRKPIRSEEDMFYAVAAAEAGIIFTDQMNTIAKQLNVLRGALSRWLLPYDNNTRIETQCSTPHSVVENMPVDFRGKLTERQVHYLVAGANEVRKLVRVKIADDNDLDQAREALKTADMFFKKLYIRAGHLNVQPFDLLQNSGAMM